MGDRGFAGKWSHYEEALRVPLIIAGAVGNFVDRVRLGYVVDFVRFHLDDRWAYPTFNVADAWITIGVALVAPLIGLVPPSGNTGTSICIHVGLPAVGLSAVFKPKTTTIMVS